MGIQHQYGMSTERQNRVLGLTPLGKGHFRVVHGLLGVDGYISHFCWTVLFSYSHSLQGKNLLLNISDTHAFSLKGFKRKKQRRRQKYALIRTTKLDDTNSGHYNPYKTAEFRERLNKNRNQNSQLHRRNHTGSQNNLQRQEKGVKS